MLSVWERLFSCALRDTSCFAAFAGRNGVTPLTQRVSTTKKVLAVDFLQFHPKNAPEWSQVRNPKFSWGGMPPDPPSRRARSALYSRTGTLLFKILDPPLCSGLMRILYYMLILVISTVPRFRSNLIASEVPKKFLWWITQTPLGVECLYNFRSYGYAIQVLTFSARLSILAQTAPHWCWYVV